MQEAVLENLAILTGKQLWWSPFHNKVAAFKPATLLQKTPTQVFSCESCENFKNTFQRTTVVANSVAKTNQKKKQKDRYSTNIFVIKT